MKRAEADKTSVLETIGKIREFRQGVAPAGASIREMIEEGRPPLRRADKMKKPVSPTGFPPVTGTTLRHVARRIGELPGVEKVILFGSYASGKPTSDSDVDIFVVWDTRRTLLDCRMKISNMFDPRPFPMDIVVRRPGQVRQSLAGFDPFIKEIHTIGKVLFEKKR